MFLTRKTLSIAGLVALGLAGAQAQSQQKGEGAVPEAIVDCADLKRDAARLACFDREVARLTQSAGAVASTPTPPAPPVAIPAPVASTPPIPAKSKEEEFGMSGQLARKRQDAEEKVQAPLEALEATVAKITTKAYGELMFELDNGQVWQQPERKLAFDIKAGEHVRITKGAMGSFFLTSDSGATTRVRRVR